MGDVKAARVGCYWMPLVLAVSQLAYLLFSDGCDTCAGSLPAWIVLVSSLGWFAVAVFLKCGWDAVAVCMSFGVVSTHLSVLYWYSISLCVLCVAFAAIGVVSAALIIARTLRSTKGHVKRLMYVVTACSIGSGFIIGSSLDPLMGPMSSRELSGEGSVSVYVVVRRNCGTCDKAEKKMVALIKEGVDARVTVLDWRSEYGGELIRQFGLSKAPAFVALHEGATVALQDGGLAESFIERVRAYPAIHAKDNSRRE